MIIRKQNLQLSFSEVSLDIPYAKINSSNDAARVARAIFELDASQWLIKEYFFVLIVNHQNVIKDWHLLSIGGMTATMVDIRIIVAQVLLHACTGIVLVHNHPSGNLKASHQDISLTRKVNDALKLMDVSVVDHIILTEDKYLSFRDEGIQYD